VAGRDTVYQLVGVVVHMGQANAGHYYSYIKERRSTVNYGRWFKFNDAQVDAVDFDETTMRDELFGGRVKTGCECALSAFLWTGCLCSVEY
jgi:ubiquitin carboxyl-terminal hydrolase 9/24